MNHYDYPPRPEGSTEQRIEQLWEALFRLVERLNAERTQAREAAAHE